MPLWNNERELEDFARSGAHLQAMKDSKQIAKEIRTLTIDANELPSWSEAKRLLEGGKFLDFSRNIPLKKFDTLRSFCVNQHIMTNPKPL
jgi:hypothetical protein